MKRSILEQSWAVAKPRHAEAAYNHRRRLAINIGAAKILEKFIFRQKILKSSLLFSPKFLTTSFFSHRQLFLQNLHLSFKMYSVFFVLLSLFLLSFMFIFF